ncbi:ABC transporter permease [Pseudonocardia sp. HH130630-07]|uniref:ABC transporter permease n=1 Tax=Pseudonocardia sp. HH130630-07 TaxID=1690815 RepID=UPI000814F4EA|nr:ABC-2 family transporter protein [Pseudonocardia sp. HH130630-07]ANY07293.1 ABC transporter permease [Pseudonocardia sp. HH130630-07]
MAEARGPLAPYRAVLASRVRAQTAYRVSFATDLAGTGLVSLVELAEIWVLFHNVPALGRLTFPAVLLVFGLAELTFATADLLVGHLDNLPTYLREGTLDVFHLRPQPLLAQLATSDIALRRLTRILFGAGAVVAALVVNDVELDARAVAVLLVAVPSGIAIYTAMFVWAGGAQFFLVHAAETTNAFTYGGRYAGSQPASVWPGPARVVFGFLFPVAFTGYLPALLLLGLPGPDWLPTWLGWCAPVAALWMWMFALGTWRLGVRHYQGAGG